MLKIKPGDKVRVIEVDISDKIRGIYEGEELTVSEVRGGVLNFLETDWFLDLSQVEKINKNKLEVGDVVEVKFTYSNNREEGVYEGDKSTVRFVMDESLEVYLDGIETPLLSPQLKLLSKYYEDYAETFTHKEMLEELSNIPEEDNEEGINREGYIGKVKDFIHGKGTATAEEFSERLSEINRLTEQEEEDVVNQPSHYKRYRLEMIDNIRNMSTPEEFKGFLKGNIIKYTARYQDKNGVEDIKKAEWYINKLGEVVAEEEE